MSQTHVSTPPTTALLDVYKMPDIMFKGGEGSWLIADDGRRYLDFTSGIGVNALGHGAPEVVGAIREALEGGLIHASNLFRTGAGGAPGRGVGRGNVPVPCVLLQLWSGVGRSCVQVGTEVGTRCRRTGKASGRRVPRFLSRAPVRDAGSDGSSCIPGALRAAHARRPVRRSGGPRWSAGRGLPRGHRRGDHRASAGRGRNQDRSCRVPERAPRSMR